MQQGTHTFVNEAIHLVSNAKLVKWFLQLNERLKVA